jgi:K+-transporting ATPase ATPase A chain
MTLNGWVQIALYVVVVLALARPLGGYLANVMAGRRNWLSPVLLPVERGFYRLAGINPAEEQSWWLYCRSVVVFHLVGFVFLYLLLRLQSLLPFNPQDMAAIPADLAGNTSVSFLTNTNWQSYGGESTMSYFSQMAGLAVQNFLSAAAGIALAMAMIRGFARTGAKGLGNFWADLVRVTLYVLLPACIVLTVFFVWQGVPQNLGAYVDATTLEGGKQTIAQGPVASQLAIKMLGTNGGGFFNANSAHPYENPTALSNFVQMIAIFVLGAALTNTFGRAVGDERQGWALLAAMGVLFIAGVAVCYWAEAGGNPQLAALGVDGSLGNMEGKEVRFGTPLSALFAVVTTDASCGAVNAMHDSFMPLGGMVPLVNILLGEIIVGGVGSGLYGMLLFAIVAIFLAGLMVGRTPEYVGKKIEAREVKMTMLAILCLPLVILGFSALASVLPAGLAGMSNAGPHGFSQIFYAFTSAAGNNGSAFAGLSANSVFWNATLGIAMVFGRFAVIVPMLAVAGSLAAKRRSAASVGTFPTHGGLFVGLLVGSILIVGGLTFLPALALGPIAEHFSLLAGTLY